MMLKRIYLDLRFRSKRKSWVWRARHQKDDLGIGFSQGYIMFMYFFSFFRYLFRLVFLLLLLCVAGGYWFYTAKLVPLYDKYNAETDKILINSTAEDFKISEGSIIYDNKYRVIADLYDTANNKYIEYKDIPENVVNAFVAIEDRTYWENEGINVKGIGRVLWRYYKTNGEEQHGASSITQQLAKNVYLTQEVTFERKIKEIFIARKLTKLYTKEQLMEFYCNDICFANGIYGIYGASKAYFNKDIKYCSLSEIAYLCAIPNSPEYYNPLVDKNTAIPRRDKILDDMLECGYITQAEHDKAIKEVITIHQPDYIFNDYETTYAVDCATKYFMRLNGFEFKYTFHTDEDYDNYHEQYDIAYQEAKDQLYHGGYRIYTSLDKDVLEQTQAVLDDVLSFNDEIDEETGQYALQGAVTVIDNKTRKTIAVVGGRTSESGGKKVYSFNRAYQAYRQPGSSFKPIAVYTPALQVGYTADSKVHNIDVQAAAQAGADAQKMSGTEMTLREAVEQSQNGVAWQIFDKITPEFGMSFITNMRFDNLCKDDYYDSAALGGLTYGVTTTQMASAYSCLANHGMFCENTCIVDIKDKTGKSIYIEEEPVKVYNAKSCDDMIDILKGVLTVGTAKGLNWSSYSDTEAFAKTGTTNDCKDGWLCGATPYYSVAVWLGYDTPRLVNGLYGSTYPGQIWRGTMLALLEGKEAAKFEKGDYTNDLNFGNNVDLYASMIRDDVISDDYTLEDYMKDREIGDSVKEMIETLKVTYDGYEQYDLYQQILSKIATIKSKSYQDELKALLSQVYYIEETTETQTASQTDAD